MYIPQGFFSTQGSCFRVTTTSITGSGTITTGSFVSGGVIWDYYQFQNTIDPVSFSSSFVADFNVLSGSTGQAKLFLVAGGGAGGYGADYDAGASDATAAGGGGGGGIVYYDQFPLASGSYAISVGTGGGNAGGRSGSNTTFTFTYPYSPFTSSVLTAYGGGKGGYIVTNNGGGYSCNIVQGTSGGSAGGAVCCNNQDGSNTIIQAGFDGFGGLNGANQGNDASGCLATGNSQWKGSGGGGAGTIGALATSTISNGGDGAPYNLTGTTLYYAAGGGGAYGQQFPIRQGKGSDGNGSSGFGNGGQGATLSFAQGTTATNGVVIIAIPKCFDQRTECRTYTVRAGSSNSALVTYYPCGVNTLTSSSLAPGNSGSICTYVIGGYPTISGVGSQITASVTCSADIQLPATCPSGTQLTNLHYYQYSNTTTGSGGERAYGNASYYNAAGTLVVADNFAYENPTEYFCAREVPQPFISSGSGILLDLGVGGCGDYCTSSYAPPTPFPPFPYSCNCYSFTAGGDGPGPEPGFVGGLDCITGQYVGYSGNSTNRVGGSYCWRTGTPSGAGTFSLSGPQSSCTGGSC
jgi:hypothetical protein